MYRAQHSTAQHSTAQHSTAQHSTAQHSTAQHSTAQPYLAYNTFYCCTRHCERAKAKCGNPVFFRDESEEHNREQRIVLAGDCDSYNLKIPTLVKNHHFNLSLLQNKCWCCTEDASPRMVGKLASDSSTEGAAMQSIAETERFSEQSEIDFQHHSDFYVQNKPFPSRLIPENNIAFYGGAIC